MKISRIRSYLVGHDWMNWLFVRVDTDDGLEGVGEGSLNGFAATVAAALDELQDEFIGTDPRNVEDLLQRVTRDLYSDGGQIQNAALAAVEIACWDIVGKATGVPVYQLLGGRIRDRVPVYVNGWYRCDRTPDAFAEAARAVVGKGYRALKFDPFGAAFGAMDPTEESLAIDLVAAVRAAVGDDVQLMVEGHSRFSVAQALSVAGRLASSRPTWFEEPVPHRSMSAMAAVASQSPVPIATGENLTSLQQFADLLTLTRVRILQPDPVYLGGLWRTRQLAAMADAHHAMLAPHNSGGPVCSAVALQLGACVPNYIIQESFDETNVEWTRRLVDRPVNRDGSSLALPDGPGLGISVNWQELERHPYGRSHAIRIFSPGWERREPRQ
jgi:galactonate dehydratase